ncbi:MAG: hypothetical protein Q4C30_09370 [Bacteroidia bacterium]|nr:hypothetical protein [Bacteroidia bacterium]
MKKFMDMLNRVGMFIRQYLGPICWGLFCVCIMQQCMISSLRGELLKMKAGEIAVNDMVEGAISAIENAIPEVVERESSSNTGWIVTAVILLLLAVGVVYLLFRMGKIKLPFGVAVTGKMWQDLQGRVVYTLTVNNKSRKQVEISDAMVEFMDVKKKRKFRMPVKDLPLTLQKGTSHSMTVSLMNLFMNNPDLRAMKALRVLVKVDGKEKHTLPQPYKMQ